MNDEAREFRIGEVYLMDFGTNGNEQSGVRPGIVFQNNVGNHFSPNIIALPLTTSIKKISQPTHVILPHEGTGLRKDSMVLCENPKIMPKECIGRYLTRIPDDYMKKVTVASLLATSAISFMRPEELLAVQQEAISLNATNFVA